MGQVSNIVREAWFAVPRMLFCCKLTPSFTVATAFLGSGMEGGTIGLRHGGRSGTVFDLRSPVDCVMVLVKFRSNTFGLGQSLILGCWPGRLDPDHRQPLAHASERLILPLPSRYSWLHCLSKQAPWCVIPSLRARAIQASRFQSQDKQAQGMAERLTDLPGILGNVLM